MLQSIEMLKVVRNTAFTILALGLTSAGLGWNKNIAANQLPLGSQQAVLAAQLRDDETPAFPVNLTFASNAVRLGQFQEITITTVPEARLDIVTTYPDSSNNHPQTLSAMADQQGNYQLRFKLDDWHNLGLFTVSVIAATGNKIAHTSGRFVLQTWAEKSPNQDKNYVYPLVP